MRNVNQIWLLLGAARWRYYSLLRFFLNQRTLILFLTYRDDYFLNVHDFWGEIILEIYIALISFFNFFYRQKKIYLKYILSFNSKIPIRKIKKFKNLISLKIKHIFMLIAPIYHPIKNTAKETYLHINLNKLSTPRFSKI